ncbi:uncharacterized protein [Linepithema humile]|uniref:uncharacterized protein isoform X1 n=2 Tax=Linepithema humile TaxID=83485 RepID=UPI00062353FE|nr:PREDICTED: uncharacterized protein LOC105669735 [Linepithema humile]
MSVSYNLPNEILEKIFNFCDVYTLSQISMVCIQFNNVAKYILMKKSEHLFVTNQKSEKFRERCKPLLSLDKNSKFIISYNWIHKEYKRRHIYQIGEINIEQGHSYFYHFQYSNRTVQITRNMVWSYCRGDLLAFKRAKNGTIKNDKNILKTDKAFIETYTHCDNYIISGDRKGIINRWEIKDNQKDFLRKPLKIHNVHYKINQINATSQHIITNSTNSLKILKYTDDRKGCTEENEIFCGNRCYIESISFDPKGTKFAVTSTDCSGFPPRKSSFLIYDFDKSYQIMNIKYDDSCRQLIWEDTHTILMRFDYSIKKIDLRTSEFVRTWDSSKYLPSRCCSSDNINTFITGHHIVVMWDQRQSVAIQTYDINGTIYALEFDSSHMYAVAGNGLYELDFTRRNYFNHKKIETFFGNFY